MCERVEQFHVASLPFSSVKKITCFVISRMRNSKLSAQLTALWIKDFSATSSDIANMLHYDLFKDYNHLQLYIFNFIDEIHQVLDVHSAQEFTYDLLCSCSDTFQDCNLPQMLNLKAKNLSTGQFKHVFRLVFFKGNGVINYLYDDEQGVNVA
ncbi:hypothetical protein HNW13_017665 [Shewanella sp. BF02_Schw]|uniref:hypothetical protein n=1 Tax=Shewanella sp. BF02_Schw TaxID=394908 RepID=UPI001AA14034|nr:hypothetical protein [Shewanella sp. BF02_Schw]MBO1897567.1 hypothetical protein [Shewanella sp. BF02_Schw]